MEKKDKIVSNANNTTITNTSVHDTDKILQLERRIKTLKNQLERLKIQMIVEKQSADNTKSILEMERESKYMLAMYIMEREHLDDLKEWFDAGQTYSGSWKENCIRLIRKNLAYVNIVEIVKKAEPNKNKPMEN